jgi:hypothetical protein
MPLRARFEFSTLSFRPQGGFCCLPVAGDRDCSPAKQLAEKCRILG